MNGAREKVASLRGSDLVSLHASGNCPDPARLTGVLDGEVLTGSLALPGVKALGLWRGKAFEEAQAGSATGAGRNRLGIGPAEIRRYRFTARCGRSAFGDRDVLLLDHDQQGNPSWVRKFHDELVEVDDGLYLATSHHRHGDGYRFLAWFALASD